MSGENPVPEEAMIGNEKVVDNKEKVDKSFIGRTEVNGIKIYVEWDKEYDRYTVWLPQVEEDSDLGDPKGEYSQLTQLNKSRKYAEIVYRNVVSEARRVKDVYELAREVHRFS